MAFVLTSTNQFNIWTLSNFYGSLHICGLKYSIFYSIRVFLDRSYILVHSNLCNITHVAMKVHVILTIFCNVNMDA